MQMFVCSVQIISRLDSQSKFQMFTLFSGRTVGAPGRYSNMTAPNLSKIFRRISEVWENAQTEKLERCHLY